MRWIRKYSLKIASYTDSLKINNGSYIEIDEMEFMRRKSAKRKLGIDKNWFIDAIDVKTRFMISSKYAKHRSQKEIKEVMSRLKEKTGQKVKVLASDGFQVYGNVVRKVYGYRSLKSGEIKHNVVTASKGEGFNIWVERMHNSIRHRTQNFRGMHGSVESAYALMKGMEIFYNFVRKHEALQGRTPSELAIPSLKFESANRWLELIKMAN